MGGTYSSIEDLKNDEDFRNMIKEAIKGSIEETNEYQKTVKKVEQVSAKAQQIGSNTVNSYGHAVLGNADKGGINITQKTNLSSVIKTLHIANYLSAETQKNPVVQVVASDMLGLSKEDSFEKELPNWYDPKYILEMLGYRIREAKFNWEESKIEYSLDPGEEQSQSYKDNVKKSFDDRQEQHKQNKIWNENHAVVREFYNKKKAKVDELQKQLDDIYNSDDSRELKQKLAEKQAQMTNATNTANMYVSLFQSGALWKVYENEHIVENKDSKDYVILDDKVKDAYNKVLNHETYKTTFKGANDDNTMTNATSYGTINKFVEQLDNTKIYGKFISSQAQRYRNKRDDETDADLLKCFINEIKSIGRLSWLNLYYDINYYTPKLKQAEDDEEEEDPTAPDEPVDSGDTTKSSKSSRHKSTSSTTTSSSTSTKNGISTNSSNNDNIDDEFIDILNEFINIYAEYQQKIVLKALYEITQHYNDDIETNDSHKASMLKWLTNSNSWENYENVAAISSQLEWDTAKESYNNIKKAYEDVSRAEIEYKNEQRTYIAKHTNQQKQIENIQNQQKAIQTELSSQEAIDAMTYYEYWDTEPISQELVNKLRADHDVKKAQFEKDFTNNEETKKSQDVFNAKSRMLNAQSDQQMWKEIIRGTPPYMKSSDILSEGFDKTGNAQIKQMKKDIENSKEYKEAKTEFTKGMTSYELQYINMGSIIASMDNDNIQQKYLNYLKALDNWNNSRLGFDRITSYAIYDLDNDYKKQNEATIDNIKTNYNSYKQAKSSEAKYKVEYIQLKNEYEDRFGDYLEGLASQQEEVSRIYAKYSEIKAFWENYDEVVNGKFYKFRTFDELYSMLAAGYTQNISKKLNNFEKLTTNIIKNMSESVTLFATNKINIVGPFSNRVDVEQTNNAIVRFKSNVQLLTDSIDNIKQQIKKNTNNKNKTNDAEPVEPVDDDIKPEPDPDDNKSTSSSVNWIVVTAVGVLVGLIVLFGLLILYKKRVGSAGKTGSINKQSKKLIKLAK